MPKPSHIALLALPWVAPQPATSQDWEAMQHVIPRGYVVYRATEPVRIDGRLDETAWQRVPWSEAFVDIEGDRKPPPRFSTRMKMIWDDEYLYVGARLEEPHVWANLTEKNSVIFHDNDFEIFIDANGDHHNYYEFEINALNTIWELALVKPYRDGGPVVSPANIEGLRSAVYVEGTLNDPHDIDTAWTVEVAIPWSGLARYSPNPVPPRPGEQWRMNFSRVQWQHSIQDGAYRKLPDTPEDNWVWSPQGVINMHCPERWGYAQFSTSEPGTERFVPDATLPARDRLMGVYYAQRGFHQTHGYWARRLDELDLPSDVGGTVQMEAGDNGFTATTKVEVADGTTMAVSVDHESRLVTHIR